METYQNKQLSPEVNERARKDYVLLGLISKAAMCHPGSVSRWLYTDAKEYCKKLMRVEILEIIARHYGISISELLIERIATEEICQH